jgi:phosphatidylserine/phosphatidylglycerophosphate/cardiolipin synthase-like enzyme
MSELFEPIVGGEYSERVGRLFDGAKKNIDIVMYDWRWYENQLMHPVQRLNVKLVQAIQRGVMVRAVCNSSNSLDLLNSIGIKARCTKDRRTVHTKMIIVDGETLVIGSHNITRNAMSHNIETSLIVSIPAGITRFAEFFNNLYNI